MSAPIEGGAGTVDVGGLQLQITKWTFKPVAPRKLPTLRKCKLRTIISGRGAVANYYQCDHFAIMNALKEAEQAQEMQVQKERQNEADTVSRGIQSGRRLQPGRD